MDKGVRTMTNLPKLGEIVILPNNWDIPVQIQAISYKYDIQDIVVIWAKSDLSNQMTAEWDIRRGRYENVQNYTNTEEAVLSYAERAFGINV